VLSIFFALVFALSATSAVGVVASRRPLYAALSLVVNMLSLALLFILLSGQFLAAAQVIVYAGAVMVLFVFVIALLNPLRDEGRGGLGAEFSANDSLAGGAQLGSIQAMGSALYRDLALPVEATALVLVVAAVGAVYLSRGK
jgi:NADH-quinone oxidoreductase subunit J